jgi:hypothetical protein
MANDFVVTREEFNEGMQEQVDNIIDIMNAVNELRKTINTQAEVLGCHRYILEKFVPLPLLEQAATEYSEQRAAVIKAEAAHATGSRPN